MCKSGDPGESAAWSCVRWLLLCGGSAWEAPASSVHPQSPTRGQQAPGDKPVICRQRHSAPDTGEATDACPM